jgi:hypothetical protein
MEERMDHLTDRYEQWKRMDLSAVALETMPKQVDKAKVLDDLLKLHGDFARNLSEEKFAELEKERKFKIRSRARSRPANNLRLHQI